jgi:hypothetical protein
MKENVDNATSLRQVLDHCCTTSRQLVSEAKCSIFFSPNVDAEVKAEVCSESNIMTEIHIWKISWASGYGRIDRSDDFIYLLERLIARLVGWKGKCSPWLERKSSLKR